MSVLICVHTNTYTSHSKPSAHLLISPLGKEEWLGRLWSECHTQNMNLDRRVCELWSVMLNPIPQKPAHTTEACVSL